MVENRGAIADLILKRISDNADSLKNQYAASQATIGFFYIDDVLPQDLAQKLYDAFPLPTEMVQKKTLREAKFIAAQMNNYKPILEEAIYAFQDPRVVEAISEICGLKNILPDEHLYAGGISLMGQGCYLNPHLDNSHDKDREFWRVLNILFYVTPEWELKNGGNLEVWPQGVKKPQVTIESRFNRLVVMATHGGSWHSVSPVAVDRARCCISNYYFSKTPLRVDDSFHVTSFRGRPEKSMDDVLLRTDGFLRGALRKLFPKGIKKVSHLYKK